MKTTQEYIEWAGNLKAHDYMAGAMLPKAPGVFTAAFIYNVSELVLNKLIDVVSKRIIKELQDKQP